MVNGTIAADGLANGSGSRKVDVAIIGAGPAGLTAGYLLTKRGFSVAIIEKDQTYVGGISRTVEHEGYRFDIGGHRFFSKSQQVVDLWNEILPDDFIQRPRMSRIYYEGKFYSYPLRAFEALWNLGLVRSTLCMASFAKAKAFPNRNVKSFEDWTVNQFGQKLYSIFFKTYTEKVWGMPCDEMSADWAAQRQHVSGDREMPNIDADAHVLETPKTWSYMTKAEQHFRQLQREQRRQVGPRHVRHRHQRAVEHLLPRLFEEH